MAQTIEFIHNASLLHDDLVDRSHLRRNKPAA
ncbi:MAG: polyprenyl synthetase family protein [Bdellovibrionales bacterium]